MAETASPRSTSQVVCMNRTRLLIGSVGVIILSAVVFTWMRYRENELLRSGPTPAFVGERINNWRNAKFEKVPLTDGEFVSRMGEVKMSGNDLLSEIQKVGLHSILANWMRCYSEGTFEAYHSIGYREEYQGL